MELCPVIMLLFVCQSVTMSCVAALPYVHAAALQKGHINECRIQNPETLPICNHGHLTPMP